MIRGVAVVALLTTSASGLFADPDPKKPAAAAAEQKTNVPEDAIVATLNGKDFTAGQILRMVEAAPFPQAKTMYQRQPKEFLNTIAVLMLFSDLAVKQGLDQQSPYKEVIDFYRRQVLAQAALNVQRDSYTPSPEEQKKFYDGHVADFRLAKVRMIYFPFSDEKSEATAKSKAAAAAGQAKLGADFAALAKANSADTSTTEAFEVKPDSAQPPAAMKAVILQSKAGTVTDPLRHDNGYYVFRVESMEVLPYEKVKDQIYVKLQDERFRAWHRSTEKQINVQIKNEAFFQNSGQQ